MLGSVEVHLVPCLRDNYAYLLHARGNADAIVVDPGEAEPVLRALAALELNLVGIWATHHHSDHIGGNAELLQRFPDLKVYGHHSDRGRIPGLTEFLADLEEFEIGELGVQALHVPGHTLGAVTYVAEGSAFTGDTLFAAGCGRLFEGTPEQLFESLHVTLGALPDETRVYCGHEYTLNNLQFAAQIEPENAAVRAKLELVRAARARGEPSLPSTMADERRTNPFLRVTEQSVISSVSSALGADRSPPVVLGALRARKDTF
jgi:hydroxyacylglutathione hydrolase